MSINVVTLVGRVGGDPDIKYFESGTVKCRLTLAVNRRSRNNDKPDWFNYPLDLCEIRPLLQGYLAGK